VTQIPLAPERPADTGQSPLSKPRRVEEMTQGFGLLTCCPGRFRDERTDGGVPAPRPWLTPACHLRVLITVRVCEPETRST
jgi:hypothetical protein